MGNRILIYAFGNPGRSDDGLGNAFVEQFQERLAKRKRENLPVPDCDFDSNFQLNIEDAERISHFDRVIFVDASVEEDLTDCQLSPLEEKDPVQFTTHAASPGYIARLCREIFHQSPEIYLLRIKGFDWEFKEGLSPEGKLNLERALGILDQFLEPGPDPVDSTWIDRRGST